MYSLAGIGTQELQVLEWLIAMNAELPIDWDEMFEYLPGTIVELKDKPGILDRIDCYETMMVPPIWLADDPHPRYPDELRIVSRREVQVCELESQPALVAT
ncbi:hypothetical protein [Microseira sp. BLCC-F43]|uniref:hypothetical protein n=1 Tax=Microseira sp. BLCC-F43 TaxID=3153602 RepID=UPI0035B9697B